MKQHPFTDAEILALHRKAVTLSHRLAGELGLDQDDAESAANVAFMEFLAKFNATKGEPGAFLHTVITRRIYDAAEAEVKHTAPNLADDDIDDVLALAGECTGREIASRLDLPYFQVRKVLKRRTSQRHRDAKKRGSR